MHYFTLKKLKKFDFFFPASFELSPLNILKVVWFCNLVSKNCVNHILYGHCFWTQHEDIYKFFVWPKEIQIYMPTFVLKSMHINLVLICKWSENLLQGEFKHGLIIVYCSMVEVAVDVSCYNVVCGNYKGSITSYGPLPLLHHCAKSSQHFALLVYAMEIHVEIEFYCWYFPFI